MKQLTAFSIFYRATLCVSEVFALARCQLEMITTFIYRPSLVTIDARNFELWW